MTGQRHPDPLLLDLLAASIMLSVSTATVERLAQSGQVRTVKIGRRTLYPMAELQRFIDKQLEAGQAKTGTASA